MGSGTGLGRGTASGPGSVAYGERDAEHQVTLRTPAELADALPYVLGYRPEDSIVLVSLHDHGGRGRFGGRARLGIPPGEDDWASAVRQLTRGLVTGGERRGARPEQMVAYLCQDPVPGETGQEVVERLRPLAQLIRTECGRLDVPVIEALCVSDGRFWSYCCPSADCCPPDGIPMGLPGTSVLAAAATYAGLQVRGTLRELRARLLPRSTADTASQELALDTAGLALVPRILDDAERGVVAEETLDMARRVMGRLAAAPPEPRTARADRQDDELLGDADAARLVLGLQDRTTRDRAAEWMEGDEAGPALRLWRALARRCVGPYGEHAAAPLTLAGWVAWSSGDGVEAREALAMALGADPDYLFARLLHQACNEGLDPESVRRCLRAERARREPGVGSRGGEEPGEREEEPVGEGSRGPSDSASPRTLPPPFSPPSPSSPSPSPSSRRRRRGRGLADGHLRHASRNLSAARGKGPGGPRPDGDTRPDAARRDAKAPGGIGGGAGRAGAPRPRAGGAGVAGGAEGAGDVAGVEEES
ncbi:DUF4192 family protein [Streptomyces sp. NPDC008150]|uniref:DUF4192 domain-containing protein n=1 Tax=Streptomyces sp. NPDC008150 TaxID=3364816 RepID=UPI0036EAA391